MFKLIVVFLLNGQPAPISPAYYNQAAWPTQAACEEFMKSPEGVASLSKLADAVHTQLSPDVVLQPYCSDKDPE